MSIEPENLEDLDDETPYKYPLGETIMLKRREQFSEELCAICYEYFQSLDEFDD